MVRFVFIVFFLAVGGYSAYWWVGSTAQEAGLKAWLDERRSAGWVADYKSLNVRGYPSRFDTHVSDLRLADPASEWAWSAPEFRILALSYQPNHVIAVWPPEQRVSSPDETITVRSEDMRASVRFEPSTNLALAALTMDMKDVTLSSTADWTAAMQSAKFATRQSVKPFAHDVFFQADTVKPARVLRAVVDPDGRLPDVFETMRVDATLGFDAPWDRRAVEGRKPELTEIEIKDFSARWGELEFEAKGQVTVDRAGLPTGEISVRAKNWKEMLALGVSAGAIPQELAGTLESGLGLIARLSGNPDTLDAPLSFANGRVSLGPVPIGRAPVLRINP